MEMKYRKVLKHKRTGLYFGTTELTRNLFHAWRFTDEKMEVWLKNSLYAPQDIEEYEVIDVQMMIQEVPQDVQDVSINSKSSKRIS